MKLKLIDEYGALLVDPADGSDLYSRLVPALRSGEGVTLDFAGIEVFVSFFFNPAIGRLLEGFSQEYLAKSLQFENLAEDGSEVIQRVIDAAIEYYNSPGVREIVDQPLS